MPRSYASTVVNASADEVWSRIRQFEALADWHPELTATMEIEGGKPTKSFAKAAIQVALADLSMSLDNVLAVAGAARDHPTVLFFGLALSVTLMAVAANLIARVIEKHRWIAFIGLAVILYVAGSMIYHGFNDPEVGVKTLMMAAAS